MRRRSSLLKALWSDQTGATAVEYALLASLIAGVIAVTVVALGVKVQDLYNRVATADW